MEHISIVNSSLQPFISWSLTLYSISKISIHLCITVERKKIHIYYGARIMMTRKKTKSKSSVAIGQQLVYSYDLYSFYTISLNLMDSLKRLSQASYNITNTYCLLVCVKNKYFVLLEIIPSTERRIIWKK